MNDPIADFLIRIKNAALSQRRVVVLPYSKLKENLAKILTQEKYLANFEILSGKEKKELSLSLAGDKQKVFLIDVKRISKPGRRVYAKSKDLKLLNRGLGIVILSTPSGLMTARQAIKENQGGEVICKVIK